MADMAIGVTGSLQCHLNRPKTHKHGCTASSGLVADKHYRWTVCMQARRGAVPWSGVSLGQITLSHTEDGVQCCHSKGPSHLPYSNFIVPGFCSFSPQTYHLETQTSLIGTRILHAVTFAAFNDASTFRVQSHLGQCSNAFLLFVEEKKKYRIAFVGYWIIPRVVLEASQVETDLAASNNRFVFCSLLLLPFTGAVNR